MGSLSLDETLQAGAYRQLTDEEIQALKDLTGLVSESSGRRN